MPSFTGFPEDFFRFLEELKQNNNREWFAAHKPRYYESVVNPMCEFIVAVGPKLRVISPHYRVDPRPHGGSMFRIYRDTRFSKDKTPYKTHAACHFRHEAGRDAHAPGFYAHFDTEGLHFGGGVWLPPSGHLAAIRDAIVENPDAWSKIRNAKGVRERGGIGGDALLKAPRGFDAKHRHIEDIRRKSFFVMEHAPTELATTPTLVNNVAAAFRASSRLNQFITQALGLPY